jgi:MFS family permease
VKAVASDRRFSLYWSATAISILGDEITLLALPWLIAAETASPLATGAFEALGFLPYLLLGLPLGSLADRGSRRRLMIRSDVVRFLVVGSVPVVVWFADESFVVHLLAVAFIAGAMKVLFEACAQPLVADIVPAGELVIANSRTSLTDGIAIVAAPALAGTLIAAVGAATTIALDALTFVASAVLLWRIGAVDESRSTSEARVWGDVRAGLVQVRQKPVVAAAMGVVGAANVGSGAVVGIVIVFMQQVVRLESWEAGLVYASNGLGVLVAGWAASRLARRIGLGRTLISGITVTTLGIALVALMERPVWVLTGALGMAIIGLGVVLNIIASTTLRQKLIPGEFLGRVTATYRTIATGALAVGALGGGALATVIGMRETLWIAAAWYAVVSFYALRTALNVPPQPGIDDHVPKPRE